MPPSKRKPRRSKAADRAAHTSDVEMADSSPSRPSIKKRKGNTGRATRTRKSDTPVADTPRHTDETDNDDEVESPAQSNIDLIEKVIASLAVSKDPVVAAQDHANEGQDDSKISAFAKIAGRDWTFYVREQTINIGRPPDDARPSSQPGMSSPVPDVKDSLPVHLDLGPSKIVSRHHASIFYDADQPGDGGWHVRVNGRNGVRVNNVLLRRGARYHINSGAVLEIAGTQMMFVTPGDRVEIDSSFIERAEAAENGGEVEPVTLHSETEGKPSMGNDLPGYPSLAPAPVQFKRASTPPHQSRGAGQNVFDSKAGASPIYGRGMMMESTQEIDYSKDAAKDLKPPYSYAHMIAQAIFASEDQKLTLSNIYAFIADKYAYYRHQNSGWQNSIRHNLSLNKAFQKVPRRTDEPGKGMKWQIAPEYREEYWKKQQRRVGTSSNPSSPAANKEINPNFRGANGQNLGYDTTMVYQFPAKDARAAAPPKLNIPFPPYPPSAPYPTSAGAQPPSSQVIHPASTPQRRRGDTDSALDDSPSAAPFPSSAPRPSHASNRHFYALPTSAGLAPGQSPTNGPTLSSSYLDTPFRYSQHSLATPAPLRQNPKLAPPSTLVAPSKFMPDSSPATSGGLFWKGFLGGMTPGPGSALRGNMPPDLSPEKLDQNDQPVGRNGLDDPRDIMSSSPPPMDDATMGSPSKPARARSNTNVSSSATKAGVLGGDLSSTTPSTGQANGHPPVSSSEGADARFDSIPPSSSNLISSGRLSLGPPAPTPAPQPPTKAEPRPRSKEEVEEEADGFDLARGFAPIGSRSSQPRASGVPG